MNCTELALKLVENYYKEFNRLRRARYAKHKISWKEEFQAEMKSHGLNPHFSSSGRKASYMRDHFIDSGGHTVTTAFVSKGIKEREIRRETQQLDWAAKDGNQEYAQKISERIFELRSAPVLEKLGKQWRAMVNASVEEGKADKARWEARCAIKAFNKMDTGVFIKFGNCGRGGGSMSQIVAIHVGDEKIPLRKFIENTTFESYVLHSVA